MLQTPGNKLWAELHAFRIQWFKANWFVRMWLWFTQPELAKLVRLGVSTRLWLNHPQVRSFMICPAHNALSYVVIDIDRFVGEARYNDVVSDSRLYIAKQPLTFHVESAHHLIATALLTAVLYHQIQGHSSA